MKVLDVFCGAGGLSLGFEKAGFHSVLGVDFNQAALDTFAKNYPNSTTLCGDLIDDEIKRQVIDFCKKNKVKGIIGGPPCQGFSLKGKKLGLNDPRNFLFKEYLYLVEQIQPDFVVMENVKALGNNTNSYFLNEICRRLSVLGLNVTYRVLNAKDYGVPQQRERIFIIGIRKKSFNFDLIVEKTVVTVRDAIADLAYLNSGDGAFEQPYQMAECSDYQRRMRKNSQQLFNHQATNHKQIALDKLKMIPPEGDKTSLPKKLHGRQQFSSTWGRLKWNQQSPTIDTRFDTPSNGCNSHPELHRSITPREAARLQSFPDDFIFYGKKTEVCKQIGNAVPPLLAFAIAKSLREQLDENL